MSETLRDILIDAVTSPYEKVLNQTNVKELQFRTARVLITRLGYTEFGKELIEVNSHAFDQSMRLNVDSSLLESNSSSLDTENIKTEEVKSLFFLAIENNGITVPWVTANEALKCGYEVTRFKWQEQKVFMTVYGNKEIESRISIDLKIFYQDKKEYSTGWTPLKEDKEANDWIIKKKT